LGHAMAAISFSAAMLGWKAQLQTVPAEYLDWVLGLKPPVHPLEPEIPEALIWIQVGPSQAAFALPDAHYPLEVLGQPNRLSAGHAPWPLIDEVVALTSSPSEPISTRSRPAARWPNPKPLPCSAPADRI